MDILDIQLPDYLGNQSDRSVFRDKIAQIGRKNQIFVGNVGLIHYLCIELFEYHKVTKFYGHKKASACES
ncbi:hypothetical protein, partial [uncultured Duncaniella sp.]|uniref:hypothetical protein n=1 Tax=uncultured Duncaniella sp. TaxID=2768039 RepID=UPI00264A1AF3